MLKPKKSPKPGPRGVPEHEVMKALTKHAGVYALAARELGIDRSAVWQRVANSEKLRDHVAEIRSSMMDLAEGVIFDALMHKDKQTARWYAERQGRDRGYVTRTEQTGADGAPLVVAPTVAISVNYVGSDKPEVEVL
jgi:hypothetical protein